MQWSIQLETMKWNKITQCSRIRIGLQTLLLASLVEVINSFFVQRKKNLKRLALASPDKMGLRSQTPPHHGFGPTSPNNRQSLDYV